MPIERKPEIDLQETNVEIAQRLGLTEEEYDRIVRLIGRKPNYAELGMFSVMWSEHCSYKSSIALLRTLPRKGTAILIGAGEENAGLVDIGDGLAIAFKIESHNHPSAVEPFQGAATGVGGIMRDIFSMGARPIAGLDSLRFGDPNGGRVRYLFDGVVRGISSYGNSFGVPTVAGEVYFDSCYEQNPLVNVMAVGVVAHNRTVRAIATGEGNPVMIVGSSTGRDGIHGASFASEVITEESESRRPSVQVGDPLTEKLLLEATLEVIERNYLIGLQDMGAAGITCSTCEMSAKGQTGMVIDLDKVPVRESQMSAYEILLSESQERMLIVARRGCEEKVKAVFEKWDLQAEVIGTVTTDGRLRMKKSGKVVVDIPADSLVVGGGAPVYRRRGEAPSYLSRVRKLELGGIPEPEDLNEALVRLLSSPNVASKSWVYKQYDTMVRTNSLAQSASDAAIVRIKGTTKAVAVKTDCNARYVYLNPRRGAMIAVAESARNVVCSGAKPIAITNCLNFGNPNEPGVYWQFEEAVKGIGEACSVLETPVTGGNVSFYNESPTTSAYPTPVIGMLGLVDDLNHVTSGKFKSAGDIIVILGRTRGEVGGSEYLARVHGKLAGDAPGLDLQYEKNVQRACLDGIRNGIVRSAHDVSDGGLAVALAECCLLDEPRNGSIPIGATVQLEYGSVRPDAYLFGEDQSRIVISLRSQDLDSMVEVARSHGVDLAVRGKVERTHFVINGQISLPVSSLLEAYLEPLEQLMSPPVQETA